MSCVGKNVDRQDSTGTHKSSSPEAVVEETEIRPSPQPSPHVTPSMFDFNQFFNIDHLPGLVVSKLS